MVDNIRLMVTFNHCLHYNKWLTGHKILELWEQWSVTTGIRKENNFIDAAGNNVKQVKLKGNFGVFKLRIIETYTTDHVGNVKESFFLFINGSPHKNEYSSVVNGKLIGENYQRFTFKQLIGQLNRLCDELHLQDFKIKIQSIEFGLNIQVPFEVQNFIERKILLHKTSLFEFMPDRLGVIFKHTNYWLKIYNKGSQYGVSDNLLRIELKFKEMEPLKQKGILYLSDLMCEEKYTEVYKLLQKSISDLLLCNDEIDLSKQPVSEEEKALAIKWINDKHELQDLMERIRTDNQLKDRFYRDKFKFRSMMNSVNDLNTSLQTLFTDEWNECFSLKQLKNTNWGVEGSEQEALSASTQKHKLGIKIKPQFVFSVSACKGSVNNLISNMQQIRSCISCGRDITDQRRDSKYCSELKVGSIQSKQCRNKASNKSRSQKEDLINNDRNNQVNINYMPTKKQLELNALIERLKKKEDTEINRSRIALLVFLSKPKKKSRVPAEK